MDDTPSFAQTQDKKERRGKFVFALTLDNGDADAHHRQMKLEAYLKERGMRSSHLAKACGVPASTISRLLSGAISNPSLELLERIAIATDGAVTPNDFLPFRAEGFGAAGGAETAQV